MKQMQMSAPAGLLAIALMLSPAPAAAAPLLLNGSFESGFAGWTRLIQTGSEGTFALQTGTASPVTATPVPAPPGGSFAAMTDAEGPGSHVLYQDFVIPLGTNSGSLTFDVFVGNRAGAFSTPNTLDFSTPALNQQARVDIVRTSADPFSVAAGDVLLNVFQTIVGGPLVTGYNSVTVNLAALLAANAGNTLRLRFAEVDNVNLFQFGVDRVNLDASAATVPEPAAIGLLGMAAAGWLRRRGRQPGR
jgi:PEP-CTERM motif-containing protein